MTDPKQVRILIVDDDETICKSITTALEEEGYIADAAENGQAAIRRSENNVYNVALIDIRLPDMDGVQLLTSLKETTPKMVKIIITGYPTLQNAVDAVNRGANAYILKPFDVGKVLKTIEQQLVKQKEEKRYSQEKVAEFIETRVKELDTQNEIWCQKRN